jgi:16S rRNA (guanine(966)-N(2))-methyltransferase RsmD
MRIIAGTLKGRRLQAPTWDGLRPSSDKVRETLFNVLAPRMDGARFLDGFAGTGAVGFEALSRGAEHVTFIERDPRASRLIEENARRCGVAGGYTILRGGVVETARREALGPFDLVFLDPPYVDSSDKGADKYVRDAMLVAMGWLAPGGRLVVEHATREPLQAVAGARLVRTLKSGDTTLSFFEPHAETLGEAPGAEPE